MRISTVKTLAVIATAIGTLAALPAHAGKTLDGIKAKGAVTCGVNTGLAGFGAADSAGKWSGLDVDVCRALAAATLGDAEKVKYVPLNAQQRFTALQSGEVDVLSRNTTFTLTRDASLGLSQTVVTYYDGQGFMVPVKSKIKSAKQLKGQTVCVQSGTTTEKNLTDYSKANKLGIKPVVFEQLEAAENAYFTGRCIAYTTDASGLASTRNKVAKVPADHIILPRMTSETLGFPSRVADDPVLLLAMPGGDTFENAEERRLFYVAMTRARATVTLITIAHKESPFLTELVREHQITMRTVDGSEDSRELCPVCRDGFMVTRKGKFGDFLGCTNYPKCKHTRNIPIGVNRPTSGARSRA